MKTLVEAIIGGATERGYVQTLSLGVFREEPSPRRGPPTSPLDLDGDA